MLRRPLLFIACFLAVILWFLTGVSGFPFSSEEPPEGSFVILSGRIRQIEEKNGRAFLFLQEASAVLSKENEKEKGTEEPLAEKEFSYRKVLLLADAGAAEIKDLRPGNRVEAKAFCTGFLKARNDGNYDEAAYYQSLGVQEKFRLKGKVEVTDASFFPVRYFLLKLRNKLRTSLEQLNGGTDSHAGIFTAIVTGDRSALDAEEKELYQKSGIAHILAISGLHISFLGMSLYGLLRRRLSFPVSALISGTAMIFFCLMTGGSASAVRAALMFLLRLFALSAGRRFDLLSALGFSAVSLLAFNPLLIRYSGFQLSFGAILGIAGLAPAFQKLLERGKMWKEDDFFTGDRFIPLLIPPAETKKKLKASFYASLSVTLITLPVIMNTYYQIPLFSVLLNLLVVPLMGLVLESGAFSALAGMISLAAGRFFIGIGVYLISLIELLCALMDRIPFSIVVTGPMTPVRCILYYAVLLSFTGLCFFRKKLRIKRKILPAVLFLLLGMLLFLPKGIPSLQITFFDADQGESILIRSPAGRIYLIDGGSTSVDELYRYRLKSALKYQGVSGIDHVIVTHPDTDHISGILSMMQERGADRIRISDLMMPEVSGNENYELLLHTAEETGIPVRSMHRGLTIRDGAVTFRCLHPDRTYHSPDPNAYSAVMELTYGDFCALFTGDLEEEGERILLNRNVLPDCDLLKVAHHGSRSSSSRAFLDAVKPEIAVISAGVNNSYGHPHPEVLERLRACGAETFVTAEKGAVTVSVSGTGKTRVRTKLS